MEQKVNGVYSVHMGQKRGKVGVWRCFWSIRSTKVCWKSVGDGGQRRDVGESYRKRSSKHMTGSKHSPRKRDKEVRPGSGEQEKKASTPHRVWLPPHLRLWPRLQPMTSLDWNKGSSRPWVLVIQIFQFTCVSGILVPAAEEGIRVVVVSLYNLLHPFLLVTLFSPLSLLCVDLSFPLHPSVNNRVREESSILSRP